MVKQTAAQIQFDELLAHSPYCPVATTELVMRAQVHHHPLRQNQAGKFKCNRPSQLRSVSQGLNGLTLTNLCIPVVFKVGLKVQ